MAEEWSYQDAWKIKQVDQRLVCSKCGRHLKLKVEKVPAFDPFTGEQEQDTENHLKACPEYLDDPSRNWQHDHWRKKVTF